MLKQAYGAFVVVLLISTCSSPSSSQSRYRLSASPDAWLAPVTFTATVGAYLFSRSTPQLSLTDLAALDKSNITSFDRWATDFSSPSIRRGSDVALGISVALPLLILSEFDADFLHLAGMYAETIALTWSVTSFIKTSGRIRPLAYNPEAPLSDRQSGDMRESFPSGHASASMAAMVFLATVYESYRPGTTMSKILWIGGIGLGLTTGSLRIFSGMHFPTDVLAGAVIGAAIGYIVPKRHETGSVATIGTTLGPNAAPILCFTIPL